jgi:hypothetical protein
MFFKPIQSLATLMKKRLFILLALSTLLCFDGLPIEACERSIKETTTINTMNNSEARMIQDIKNAYEALSKSNDPFVIAKDFGNIMIFLRVGYYELKPFNTDLELIRILTRKDSPSLPHTAYGIDLIPKKDTKILVSAIQKHFGEYLEIPPTISPTKTIAFTGHSVGKVSESFITGIDYDSDKEFSEAVIRRIHISH